MEPVIPGNVSPKREVKILGEPLAFDLDLNTPIIIDLAISITDDDHKIYRAIVHIMNKGNSTIELQLVFQEKVLFNYLKIDLKILNYVEPFTFDMNLFESNPTIYASYPKKLENMPNKVLINFFEMFYILYETPYKFWIDVLDKENEERKFTDFQIVVINEDKEKYTINVNKILLYYQSSVFRKAIDADMLETRTNTITIRDFSISTVREMVAYLYSKKVNFSNIRPHRLFRLAHIYDLKELQTECKHHFVKNLTVSNVHDIVNLMNFDDYNLSDIEMKVHSFVMKNHSYLVRDKKFMKSYQSTINVNNVHTRFEFAMNSKDKNFQYKVKSFIQKYSKEVMEKNKLLKQILTLEWSIDLLHFISTNEPKVEEKPMDMET